MYTFARISLARWILLLANKIASGNHNYSEFSVGSWIVSRSFFFSQFQSWVFRSFFFLSISILKDIRIRDTYFFFLSNRKFSFQFFVLILHRKKKRAWPESAVLPLCWRLISIGMDNYIYYHSQVHVLSNIMIILFL